MAKELVEGKIEDQIKAIEGWALKANEEAKKSPPNLDKILENLKNINLQARKLHWRGAGLKSLPEGELKDKLNKKLSEIRAAAMTAHGSIRRAVAAARIEAAARKEEFNMEKTSKIIALSSFGTLKILVSGALKARKLAEEFASGEAQIRQKRDSLVNELATDPRYVHSYYGPGIITVIGNISNHPDMELGGGWRLGQNCIIRAGDKSGKMLWQDNWEQVERFMLIHHIERYSGTEFIRGRRIGRSYAIFIHRLTSQRSGRACDDHYVLLIPESKIKDVVPFLAENPVVVCQTFAKVFGNIIETTRPKYLDEEVIDSINKRLKTERGMVMFEDLPV